MSGTHGVEGQERLGFVLALSAYLFWGVAPLYFAVMEGIGAVEVVIHRTLWSSIFLAVWITVTQRWHRVTMIFKTPRTLLAVAISAPLIAVNWTIFVWAIEVDRLTDASLGYFLNPLMFIVGGVLVFQERLSRVQVVALVIAVIGVAYLTIRTGELLWIAPALAGTFAAYGLIRKWGNVPPTGGLLVETAALLPIAALMLGFGIDFQGMGAQWQFGRDWVDTAMLAGVGLVTILPLIWFNAGAQRLPYKYMGFMQFIAPSIMFVLAIFVLNEPMEPVKLQAFIAIWAALLLLVVEQLKQARQG